MSIDISELSGLIADSKNSDQKTQQQSKIIAKIVEYRPNLSRLQIEELEKGWEDSFGWRLNIRLAGD